MTTLIFTIVHEHLEDDGVLVVNIGRPANRALVNDLATTIKQVFEMFCDRLPDSFNSILFAAKTRFRDHVSKLFGLSENDADPLLLEAMACLQQSAAHKTRVYTDDRTIEWLTNKSLWTFFFQEEWR